MRIAAFFEVTPRTIDNCIEKCGKELRQNGYEVLRGNRLKTIKLSLKDSAGRESGFVTKTSALGVFDFRSFLNLDIRAACACGRQPVSGINDTTKEPGRG